MPKTDENAIDQARNSIIIKLYHLKKPHEMQKEDLDKNLTIQNVIDLYAYETNIILDFKIEFLEAVILFEEILSAHQKIVKIQLKNNYFTRDEMMKLITIIDKLSYKNLIKLDMFSNNLSKNAERVIENFFKIRDVSLKKACHAIDKLLEYSRFSLESQYEPHLSLLSQTLRQKELITYILNKLNKKYQKYQHCDENWLRYIEERLKYSASFCILNMRNNQSLNSDCWVHIMGFIPEREWVNILNMQIQQHTENARNRIGNSFAKKIKYGINGAAACIDNIFAKQRMLSTIAFLTQNEEFKIWSEQGDKLDKKGKSIFIEFSVGFACFINMSLLKLYTYNVDKYKIEKEEMPEIIYPIAAGICVAEFYLARKIYTNYFTYSKSNEI